MYYNSVHSVDCGLWNDSILPNGCPHLFPKQASLSPEIGDFPETGKNGRLCIRKKAILLPETSRRFRQQNRLFPETKSPVLTMKSPETGTKSPVSGYKVTSFGNKCGLDRP